MGPKEAVIATATHLHSLLDGQAPHRQSSAVAEALQQLLGAIDAVNACAEHPPPTRDSCLTEVQASCQAAEVLCRLQPKLCSLQQPECVQAAAALLPAATACCSAALKAVKAHYGDVDAKGACTVLRPAVDTAASAAKLCA